MMHVHPAYLKQVTNKDLLYSTRNSAQYSIVIEMGKECIREYLKHFAVLQKHNIVNQLDFNKINVFNKTLALIKNAS